MSNWVITIIEGDVRWSSQTENHHGGKHEKLVRWFLRFNGYLTGGGGDVDRFEWREYEAIRACNSLMIDGVNVLPVFRNNCVRCPGRFLPPEFIDVTMLRNFSVSC